MRWEELFDDLEGRFEEQERSEAESDLVDLVRGERDRIGFVDRLRAHRNACVTLDLRDGSSRRGTLLDVGKDWVLLRASGRESDLLVPVNAVTSAAGLSQLSLAAGESIGRRLRLNSVLRGLVRDRAGVAVDLWPTGHLDGTIDRVGADHLDLAIHPPDAMRRAREVRQVRTVPFEAVAVVAVR
ncbi:hypothetical protein LWF15_04920 [Kineosporia rhizophila]|uniref:hypothetical protein n=1 Tax=Kineosporia TaxID=49184 RepID=UPI000A4D1410|nr:MULTISPECIES: hypothetical protein [Kineosporia]MCE0534843.1 hypothetical protein [Kineosporia rhizophila]GLY14880.1 hypothetical protein Kisp01_18950 [Kineosporia sp. NBRC 101677]